MLSILQHCFAVCDTDRCVKTAAWVLCRVKRKKHQLWQTNRICIERCNPEEMYYKELAYSSWQQLLWIAIKREQHSLDVQHTVKVIEPKQGAVLGPLTKIYCTLWINPPNSNARQTSRLSVWLQSFIGPYFKPCWNHDNSKKTNFCSLSQRHSQFTHANPLNLTLLANIINQSPVFFFFCLLLSQTKNSCRSSSVPHLLKPVRLLKHPMTVLFSSSDKCAICPSTSGGSVMARAWVTATEL